MDVRARDSSCGGRSTRPPAGGLGGEGGRFLGWVDVGWELVVATATARRVGPGKRLWFLHLILLVSSRSRSGFPTALRLACSVVLLSGGYIHSLLLVASW